MANLLYANNAAGTLASGITNVATTLTLNAGQAALFPAPAPPQVFYATITDAATQTLIEIVQVTAVSGNIFSIVRAQDGTSALSWSANDIVSQRTIALELRGFENAAEGNFAALSVPVTPLSTSGIIGTKVGDNANAGSVGEYVQNFIAAVATPNGVTTPAISLNLTAGDWDVSGFAQVVGAASTIINGMALGIGATSGAFTPIFGSFLNISQINAPSSAGTAESLPAPVTRINIASPTTVFLNLQVVFSNSGPLYSAFIRARRVR